MPPDWTAWKAFADALVAAPASSAPWSLPLAWPAGSLDEGKPLQQIAHWPLGFEDVSAQWGHALGAQVGTVSKAVATLRHGHLERDWLNTLGALAVVSEFWRIHHALERYQAQSASIHVRSVAMLPHDYRWDPLLFLREPWEPMLPHDYRWEVRLHGANAQAERDLNGRWSTLKQKWRAGLGKTDEPTGPGLAFPTAFPEEWLGEGTKLLLAPWPNPPRVAGGYELVIEADQPLADQVGVWFGSGYQKQWLQRHLEQTLDKACATVRRPRM